MKKLLLISLILLCLLGFSGCSQKEASGNKPESTVETASEPEDAQTEETAFHLSRGSWDAEGKVFVNESTGIRIQISDDYLPVPDSELAQLFLGRDEDLSSWTEEEFKTEMGIPDCQFSSNERGQASVLYENLAAENATEVTEDLFVTIVVTNTRKQYEDLSESEVYDLMLSGQSYRACDIVFTNSGIQINETIAVRRVGDYMATVIFGQATGRDYINEMIAFFN